MSLESSPTTKISPSGATASAVGDSGAATRLTSDSAASSSTRALRPRSSPTKCCEGRREVDSRALIAYGSVPRPVAEVSARSNSVSARGAAPHARRSARASLAGAASATNVGVGAAAFLDSAKAAAAAVTVSAIAAAAAPLPAAGLATGVPAGRRRGTAASVLGGDGLFGGRGRRRRRLVAGAPGDERRDDRGEDQRKKCWCQGSHERKPSTSPDGREAGPPSSRWHSYVPIRKSARSGAYDRRGGRFRSTRP